MLGELQQMRLESSNSLLNNSLSGVSCSLFYQLGGLWSMVCVLVALHP